MKLKRIFAVIAGVTGFILLVGAAGNSDAGVPLDKVGIMGICGIVCIAVGWLIYRATSRR